MPQNVFDHVRRLFPDPWTIGWNRYADIVQVEVNLKLGYQRFERRSWTAGTWSEVLAMVTA